LFAKGRGGASDTATADDTRLVKRYEKIGELTVEPDSLAKDLVHEPDCAAVAGRPNRRRVASRTAARLRPVYRWPPIMEAC
jgi:hypothetical protein